MKFTAWFAAQQGLTQEAFAKRVGVTQGRIAQILAGDVPSMPLAAKIQQETDGAVTLNDFFAAAAAAGRPEPERAAP